MQNELEKKVLEAYKDGSDLGLIITSFNITHKAVKKILINYKEMSKYRRTFTDEFKIMIAERDLNGVSRQKIATELEINPTTVKRACEKFGQSNKETVASENQYTELEGDFSKDACPSCKSNKVNEVDEDNIYCMDCGGEFIFKKNSVSKINWEYLE